MPHTVSLALQVTLSIGLGLVCGVAATPKLRAPRPFVLATVEFRVLPRRAAIVAGWSVPWVEWAHCAR